MTGARRAIANALALGVAIATATAGRAAAAPCTGLTPSGGKFALCFDPGNRLSIVAGSDGFGAALALRQVKGFADDPDLVWKLAHVFGDVVHAGFEDRLTGVVYRGRFLRHARDGHLVIPLGRPRKIFLPFDLGGEVEVGRIAWRPGSSIARLGVVELAPLIDLARTATFRRRLAIGPVARWEVELDRDRRAVARHSVMPFSAARLELAAESATGRTEAALAVELGAAWQGDRGWQRDARAEASLEQVVLAVNDRPIAIVVGARYASADDEAIAHAGLRIVLAQRKDPRVR